MDSRKKIKMTVQMREEIFGGEIYNIIVDVTNISNEVISNLDVKPTLICGKELINNISIKKIEISELLSRKRKIINEMECQARKIYIDEKLKSMTFIESLNYHLEKNLSNHPILSKMNIWLGNYDNYDDKYINQALTIDDLEDAERLRKELDIEVKDKKDKMIIKAYNINYDKLKNIIDKMQKTNGLDRGMVLDAGQTISIPFRFKAPNCIREIKSEVQFKATYLDEEIDTQLAVYDDKKISILPSSFAVPLGSAVGSLFGFAVKFGLISESLPQPQEIKFHTIIATVLLGIIIGLVTSRKDGKIKIITVEDFWSGLIIGSFVGLFSDTFIEKLKVLVK